MTNEQHSLFRPNLDKLMRTLSQSPATSACWHVL